MEYFEYERKLEVIESLKQIEYTLKYRLTDTLIIAGNIEKFNVNEICQKIVGDNKKVRVLYLNCQLESLFTICDRGETLKTVKKIHLSEVEYENYIKKYFSDLIRYYKTESTNLTMLWVGSLNSILDVLQKVCIDRNVNLQMIKNYSKKDWQFIWLNRGKKEKKVDQKMKIAIVGKMGKYYSGGRYHAWIWAESLAYMGNQVYFIANEEPIFTRDTNNVKKGEEKKLHLVITNNFEEDIEGISELDYVLMVPHRSEDCTFFHAVRNFGLKMNAKMVLLNFESPNWMNAYLEERLNEGLWKQWLETCKSGCMILSTDQESTKYAKDFYTVNPQNTIFRYCYLAINTMVADKVNLRKKENRILSFIRLQDKHKGSYDILKVIGSGMQGYTFVFVIGANTNDASYLAYIEQLESLKIEYGIDYEIKLKISDEEKYEELSRAKYLLFPSYFEGYGIPPVEAMYFNTKCLAYDLPVIHEVCEDGVIYCEYGKPEDMKKKLTILIQEDKCNQSLRQKIYNIASFECGAKQLNKVFEETRNIEWRDSKAEYLLVN